MTAILAQRPALAWRAWARTIWRAGPERWLFVVAGLGWLALIGHAVLGGYGPSTTAPDAMAHHHMPGMTMDTSAGHSSSGVWLVGSAMWLAMLAATMLPLVAPNVRYVALRSPTRRRTAATLQVITGWLVPWAGAAVVLAAGSWLLVEGIGRLPAVAVMVVVAAGWQFSAGHRVAVARCHRTFAPPLDGRASGACLRFGVRLGADCVASCWALMAVMVVCEHRLLVVGPLAWVSWFERRRPHYAPGTGTGVAVLAAVAAGMIIVSGT
jgi:predicted metal-binding membrane protein